MSGALARRGAVIATTWQRATLSGEVSLWLALLADDGRLIGAAEAPQPPRWEWRDGLVAVFGNVHIRAEADAWVADGWLIAVSRRSWAPVARLRLDIAHRQVERGWVVTLTEPTMAIRWDDPP